MRTTLFLVGVFILVAGCGGGDGGGGGGTPPLPEMFHSGDITADETWDAQHIHIVEGDISIYNNAVVTIEAGATVKIDAGCFIYVGSDGPGGLVAVGDASHRITFTANSAAPTAGFWGAIWFDIYAFNTSELNYCNIEYAGYDSGLSEGDGAVIIEGDSGSGTSVKVANCNIRFTGASGSGAFGILVCRGGSFVSGSSGNTISDSDGYPIYIDARFTHTLESGTYTGNGIDRILIDTYYEVTDSGTWINPGVPYEIDGSLRVEGASSPTLTLTAGSTLLFTNGGELLVGYNDYGGLNAVGTSSEPIIFSSAAAVPSPGDWVGVYFDALTLAGSTMEYCIVEYAGYDSGWGEGDGGIMIEGDSGSGTSVKVANCTIRNIGAGGSGAFGILLAWGGSFASGSSGNTVTDCDGYPIRIDARFAHTLESGTYTGNGIDRILVDTYYEVTDSGTWINPGIPYEIDGTLQIEGSSNPVLTLTAGSTLLFKSGGELLVGYNDYGGLNAVGTSSEPITFSSASASPSAGDWLGITFDSYALASTLEYCVVRYGGADSGTSGYDGDDTHGDDGNIRIFDEAFDKVTIQNSAINDSLGYGIIRGWSLSGHGAGPDYTSGMGNSFSGNNWGDQSDPRS